MTSKQKFGLGRGLGSLIPNLGREEKQEKNYFSKKSFSSGDVSSAAHGNKVSEIPVEKIISNTHQPRQYFREDALRELANSIEEHGILQPLVVLPEDKGSYELVAGERRLRAAKIAGLRRVPVIIRPASDLDKLELALIENIQRSDLNPIEEAESYQKLSDHFGITHEQIAKRLGKSRSAISNSLRLLSLPGYIKEAIAVGQITEGHAKVLISIKDEAKQKELFKRVLKDKLSVSDVSYQARGSQVRAHQRQISLDPNLVALEDELRSNLGTKVTIRKRGKSGGQIVIEYFGEEELADLVGKLR